jgi:hypothetical protein
MQSIDPPRNPGPTCGMNQTNRPPGLLWVAILGGVGFVTGFIGPMIFVPEANQGPMVGIFISGPAGAALGFVLYGACRLLKLSAQTQWRFLSGVAVPGAIAVVLAIQPQPALRGTLYDGAVTACRAPREATSETLLYWKERIAEVTWAEPRDGWERDMQQTLEVAPGILVSVGLTRTNSVFENRKPWNRGSIFARGWTPSSDVKSFYYSAGSCADFPLGREVHGFQKYDLGGKIEPPKEWPPSELEAVIDASPFFEVPEPFKAF